MPASAEPPNAFKQFIDSPMGGNLALGAGMALVLSIMAGVYLWGAKTGIPGTAVKLLGPGRWRHSERFTTNECTLSVCRRRWGHYGTGQSSS